MALSKPPKGKSMPSSVSNFSIRYHTEDEQLEELYETPENKPDSQADEINPSTSQSSLNANETQTTDTKSSGVLGRLGKRSVSLETPIQESKETSSGDTWRLFREVRGRITKTVEEKIEEIKSERLKNHQNKTKRSLGQMEHSSMSDSEDVSESSTSLKENVEKNENKPVKGNNDKTKEIKSQESEGSSRDSSEERSMTPLLKQDCTEEELIPVKKENEERKKSTLSSTEYASTSISKTMMTYSKLCDKENDEEKPSVEVGMEAHELEETSVPRNSQSPILRDTADFSPTFGTNLYNFISDWMFVILPFAAMFLHWAIELSGHTLSFLLGAVVTLEGQLLVVYIKDKLDLYEPMGVQLNQDTEQIFSSKVEPLLQSSEYRKSPESPEKIKYEGWMNQFMSEYKPETYHISLSKSVYVRLVGSTLSLAYPRNKVAKRAMWNEVKPKLLFDKVHMLDIYDCTVSLLPCGLIHRRCWSKKYPICINLKPSSSLGIRIRNKGENSVVNDVKIDTAEEPSTLDTLSLGSEGDSEEEKPLKQEGDDSHSHFESESDFTMQDLKETQSVLEKKEDEDSDDEFVKVPMTYLDETNLYLFARTDREKEIWFRRFVAAVGFPGEGENITSSLDNVEESLKKREERRIAEQDYLDFMHRLSQREPPVLPSVKESNNKASAPNKTLSISPDLMWFNLFFGRLLYDVLRDDDLLGKIQEKIQRKMSAIKLPFFMEQLVISHIDFGEKIPIVQRSTPPTINSEGIWVDLDIIYEGGFKMTVDTKLNLMKLKNPNVLNEYASDSPSHSPVKVVDPKTPSKVVKLAVFDSEVEDSAESSSEEPDLSRLAAADPVNSPAASGKYIRLLESVAQSKYFQHVTDYRVIRNMMEGVSNKNITLLVEVQGLVGTLVLNLPSPPTDRLWYGFRSNPMIWISATPKFGERAVTMLNITRLIERKLCKEFEKLLVIPNMDDLVIPLMSKGMPS